MEDRVDLGSDTTHRAAAGGTAPNGGHDERFSTNASTSALACPGTRRGSPRPPAVAGPPARPVSASSCPPLHSEIVTAQPELPEHRRQQPRSDLLPPVLDRREASSVVQPPVAPLACTRVYHSLGPECDKAISG